MAKVINYNALNQILDTTFGRSSTPQSASYSVKFSFSGGDRLIATYIGIINFPSRTDAMIAKKSSEEDADRLVKSYIKSLKTRYKELTGEIISLKDVDETDSVEMIGGGYHHTSKRSAYYRKTFIFELA